MDTSNSYRREYKPITRRESVERHALQRRIARLESLMKVPKDKRHVFAEQLNKATDIEIKGKQLGDKITGKKSHWQSTLPDKEESVSVEELSLEHYREEGWKGMHSENSILTCLVSPLGQYSCVADAHSLSIMIVRTAILGCALSSGRWRLRNGLPV